MAVRYIPLLVFLVATPVVAQEVDDPTRVPLSVSKNYTEHHEGIALDFEMGLLYSTDPFGQHKGGVPFSAPTTGIASRFDTHRWYIELTGQLLNKSLRQRKIVATLDRFLMTTGSSSIGLEVDYWELGFRRRAATAIDIELDTKRQSRAVMAGPILRYDGPRHVTVRLALTAGKYWNQYDSVVIDRMGLLIEPLVKDQVIVSVASLGFQTKPIWGRIQIAYSVRYARVWGDISSWTPRDEWSSDGSIDIRLVGVRKKSLHIGAIVRFGPAGAGLISDKTFGLRGTWKVR